MVTEQVACEQEIFERCGGSKEKNGLNILDLRFIAFFLILHEIEILILNSYNYVFEVYHERLVNKAIFFTCL